MSLHTQTKGKIYNFYCLVIKVIAKDKGFADIPMAKQVRRTCTQYRGLRLACKRLTSSLKLQQMKRRPINFGKIDVGIPIVPIDYCVMKVNKQGKLVCKLKIYL